MARRKLVQMHVVQSALSGCAILIAPGLVLAQSYCPWLDGQTIVVGEGRFALTSSNAEEYYANAYHDAGQELTLGVSYPVGWLGSSQSFTVGAAAYLEDRSSTGCRIPQVDLYVYTKGTYCSASTYRGFDEYKVNTCSLAAACDPDEECFYYGGDFLTKSVLQSYGNIYYEVVTYTYGGSTVPDSGCLNVGNSGTLCY